MPRKSAAALSVVRPLPVERRPEPPSELTEEQAAEWRSVVDRLPADWFPRETHQLLVQYCRHVVKARVLAEQINSFKKEWLNSDEGAARYKLLTGMAEKEGRAISLMMVRMRLTPSSRVYKETATNKANRQDASAKPWQGVA